MREIFQEIIRLVRKAAELGRSVGIPNVLQPGLVKEMIVADILGHKLITAKRGADACDPARADVKYEYLSCVKGGSGQLDRMFKSPPDKREESLQRITRNAKVFLAVFNKKDQTEVETIYELDVDVVAKEACAQLDRSKNDISHVAFTEKWAAQNGRVVYLKNSTKRE